MSEGDFMKMQNFFKVILTLMLFPLFLMAHGDKEYKKGVKTKISEEKISFLKEEYEKKIKPIFKRACFDCHSRYTVYPWYYKIPIVKQLIDHDIEEAREHLDMSEGFPFKSHEEASLVDIMEEIAEVIEEGEMPLFRYVILHKEARLTDKEKQLIIQWAKSALSR
ncbi:MAG: cytochrome C [Bdellovibrio sp.]|nr:MAG: cytochrome C [Bdellovibrio sp.]